ncbi:MAG: glycosyltransferase [Nitrospirae bacterium]|nr:glycosyltransferase [Nitrospirota bacterium]
MKKILFVIPTLSGGGSERVMVHLIRNIDRSKFNPCLVLFEKKGQYLEDLPSNIQIFELKKGGYKYGFQWLILFKLRKLIEKQKPDIILSFMWYTNLIALIARSLSKSKCRIAVSERYGLLISHEGWLIELLRRQVIRFFYPKANLIIVNAKEMGIQLRKMLNISENKIAVIYNPVDLKKINQLCIKDAHHLWYKEQIPIITAVGRLTLQKGFTYLLKAVRILLLSEGIQCRLVILGRGPEQERLEKLAVELGINTNVEFFGFQTNPYKYLARSTVFVLSSLYEGFPNVLLEAMALGIPSVATRCPTGPDEIITEGVDGILVPSADEKAIADAIKKLLLDDDLRKRLSEAGKRRIQDFAVEKIVKQYEDAIESVCAESAEG